MSFSSVHLLQHSRQELRNWWLDNIGSLYRNEFIRHIVIKHCPTPSDMEHIPDGSVVCAELIGIAKDDQCQIAIVRCRRLAFTGQSWFPVVMAMTSGTRLGYAENLLEQQAWKPLTGNGYRSPPLLFGVVESHAELNRTRPVYPQTLLNVIASIDCALSKLDHNICGEHQMSPTKALKKSHESWRPSPSKTDHKEEIAVEDEIEHHGKNVFEVIDQQIHSSSCVQDRERLSRLALNKLESTWVRYDGKHNLLVETGCLTLLRTVMVELTSWEDKARIEQRIEISKQKLLNLERTFMAKINDLTARSAHTTKADHDKVLSTYGGKFKASIQDIITLWYRQQVVNAKVQSSIYCTSMFRYSKMQQFMDLMLVQLVTFPMRDLLHYLMEEDFMYLKVIIVHSSSELLEEHLNSLLGLLDLGPAKSQLLVEALCRRQVPIYQVIHHEGEF